MCIQLDTGNASYDEIAYAIKKIEEQGNRKIIIHHCPTGYPADIDSVQLAEILVKLKKLFNYPVAFSDHTPGWHMNIAAICLGANMIEKTITTDRTTPSVEHMFSLEEEDVRKFITEIREVEKAIKDTERKLNPDIKSDMQPVEVCFRSPIYKRDENYRGSHRIQTPWLWFRPREIR